MLNLNQNFLEIPTLLFFLTFGCGVMIGNPDSDDDGKQDIESPPLTPSDIVILSEKGDNEIGVSKEEFHLAVLIDPNQQDVRSETFPVGAMGLTSAKVIQADEADTKKCSGILGKTVNAVKITGTERSIRVDSKNIFAVKLSGNHSSINLLLTNGLDQDPVKAPGVCIIASGNQPVSNIVVNGIELKEVVYIARGNKAKAAFEIRNDASIENFSTSLKGNIGETKIFGEGSYDCQTILRNNQDISCGIE